MSNRLAPSVLPRKCTELLSVCLVLVAHFSFPPLQDLRVTAYWLKHHENRPQNSTWNFAWHLRKLMGKTQALHISITCCQGGDIFVLLELFIPASLLVDRYFENASSEIYYQFAKQALWVLSSVVRTDNLSWQARQSTTDYQLRRRCWSQWQSWEVYSNSDGLRRTICPPQMSTSSSTVPGQGKDTCFCSFVSLTALVGVSTSSHKSSSLLAGLWEPCRVRGQAALCKLLCWWRHTTVPRGMRAMQVCLRHKKLRKQNYLC